MNEQLGIDLVQIHSNIHKKLGHRNLLQLKAKGIFGKGGEPEEEELSISELTSRAKTAIKEAPKQAAAPAPKKAAPPKVTVAAKAEPAKNTTEVVAQIGNAIEAVTEAASQAAVQTSNSTT